MLETAMERHAAKTASCFHCSVTTRKAITVCWRNIRGVPLNLAAPKESLLLQKAIGIVAHTGGELFTDEDEAYRIIHDWISAGAPRDPESTPEVKGIRMEPPAIEFASPKRIRQIKIVAEYTDGSERDVTRWCRFISSNDGVVSIDDSGSVTGNRPGERTSSPASRVSRKALKSSFCRKEISTGRIPNPTTTSTNSSSPNLRSYGSSRRHWLLTNTFSGVSRLI